MRKLIVSLLLFSFTFSISAQNKFSLKRENIDDFPGKTTKVVLMGNNSFLDLYLKDAISINWKLSPYEFCDMAEFETIKSDTSYYFLVRTDGMFKKEKESSVEFLTLVKGGTGDNLASMDEILALPLQPLNDQEGRIISFLPAYIKIIQDHIVKVMNNKLPITSGISTYADELLKNLGKKTILFEKGDFAFDLTQDEMDKTFGGKVRYASRDEIDEALDNGAADTVVALLITTPDGNNGDVCYRILIGCDDKSLYMFRNHKISKRNPKGFIKEDYKRISVPFSF
jgi:hypothetical protein